MSCLSSAFTGSKNISPVSGKISMNEKTSMSPKKRGKRRLKENMENEEPYLMSNFNSNISASAKVSDGNLLSSASSIYNVTGQSNGTGQSNIHLVDSYGNPCSATSLTPLEYSEEPASADQYFSNENRVISMSPTQFDRYIKFDPN